jgi:elongation factor G
VREGTLSRKLTPVFIGSAYKNVGVQLVLDAVNQYLPAPDEVENVALDLDQDEKELSLKTDPEMPVVALAFKLEVTPYGQLTYLRI